MKLSSNFCTRVSRNNETYVLEILSGACCSVAELVQIKLQYFFCKLPQTDPTKNHLDISCGST